MTTNLIYFGLYLIAVIAIDWLAYLKLHRRWQRRERARTTIGVLIVILPALPLVAAGLIDLLTWFVLLSGFVAAGAVTLFLDIHTETTSTESLRREIKELINYAQGDQ